MDGASAAASNEINSSTQESVRKMKCKVSADHETPKGEAREHSMLFLKKAVSEKGKRQRKTARRK